MTKANFIYPHTLPGAKPTAAQLADRWTDVPLPPLADIPGPLRVAPGETWCAHCGAVMMPRDATFTGEPTRTRCCACVLTVAHRYNKCGPVTGAVRTNA